ncbi:MAG: Fic family protein [Bacteroides sp.]|nr:Fic family protein [Bacteroides sp.]
MPDFDEYIRQGESDKQEKAHNWQTAIGLQAVDGLRTSEYLLQTARQHIEGEIDIDTAQKLLKSYYQSKTIRLPEDDDMEEADKVAANITKILSTRTLAFNANGYIAVHRQVFEGVFKFAGKIRDYDITKKEWVLRGDTVSYLNHEDLHQALEYDIEQERNFDYSGLQMKEVVKHIAQFVSDLWQIHAFGEGNTRTTAVFTIQYLRSIGFDINNELFARHSWYFRNALVRANYKNAQKGIMYDLSFLERFFGNLLMGEKNELKNRYMIIDAPKEWKNSEQVPNKYRTSTEQAPDRFHSDNANILKVIKIIGKQELSVKEMLEKIGMKHRPTFLENYLNPAFTNGYITLLFPNSPKHPRQKYLLTVKGLALYNEIISKTGI